MTTLKDTAVYGVLKDASATAVYGVRGAIGKLTKPNVMGRSKPQFSVDHYEGFVTLTKKPEQVFTYMDAANEVK